MSEMWRSQDQSPNRERLCYTMFDLATSISFVKPPEALQAWVHTCLLHWCKANLLCGFVVSLFLCISGTIYYMWQLPEFATNFIRQGVWWLMVVFLSVCTIMLQFCTHLRISIPYNFSQTIKFTSFIISEMFVIIIAAWGKKFWRKLYSKLQLIFIISLSGECL
jgi:hypothetical protein